MTVLRVGTSDYVGCRVEGLKYQRISRIFWKFGLPSVIAFAACTPCVAQDQSGMPEASTPVTTAELDHANVKAKSETATSSLDKPEYRVGSEIKPANIKKGSKYDISTIGERDIDKGVNFYSLAREQALGKQISQEVESQSKIITDPAVTEYINRIGQTIVRNSDAKVPFVIKVVDNDEVNAFALPGGFFYVNSGLIFAADNEAELAGVMAHEIAHVAARHATRTATKGQIWNFASIPLLFVGGPAGFAVQQVAGVAGPMSFLKFGRDAEREADLLGIQYDYVSGYDPAYFVQFFEKVRAMEKKKPGFLANAFATHPMTSDRIKRAQREIQELLPAKDEYIVDTSEFQTVKARLYALINGNAKVNPDSLNRPTLRRHTNDRSSEGGPVLHKRQGDVSDTGSTSAPSDSGAGDDRPTLKRSSSSQN